jgi:hypothetical protein
MTGDLNMGGHNINNAQNIMPLEHYDTGTYKETLMLLEKLMQR